MHLSGTRGANRRRAAARWHERVWAFVEPVLVWLPAALLILPLVFLIIGSFSERWDSRGLSGLSLSAYHEAWGFARKELTFSLSLATTTTIVNVLLGVPLGYALATRTFPGRSLIESLLSLPVILPAMVLSMGLILGYPGLIGTWLILFLAHSIWTLPFIVWPVLTALRGFDGASLSAAARTLGATEAQVFTLVMLPNLRNSVILGAVLSFIISFAEINGSLFLSSTAYRPIGVGLLESFMNLDLRVAAAYTVIFLAALAPVLLLALKLQPRDG